MITKQRLLPIPLYIRSCRIRHRTVRAVMGLAVTADMIASTTALTSARGRVFGSVFNTLVRPASGMGFAAISPEVRDLHKTFHVDQYGRIDAWLVVLRVTSERCTDGFLIHAWIPELCQLLVGPRV